MFNRFQLGDWLPLASHVVDGDGVTAAPDSNGVVTAKIFDAAGDLIETVNLPSRPERISELSGGGIQYHEGQVLLDGDYAVGKYMIVYTYTVDAALGGSTDTFEIVAGGSASGAVIASYFHDLPNANNVVFQLDNGDLRRRINPR